MISKRREAIIRRYLKLKGRYVYGIDICRVLRLPLSILQPLQRADTIGNMGKSWHYDNEKTSRYVAFCPCINPIFYSRHSKRYHVKRRDIVRGTIHRVR